MKVTVNETQPVKQEIKPGMIVKATDNDYESIILVTEYLDNEDTFKGISLYHVSNTKGYLSTPLIQNTLIKKYFTPFLGTITLSNDEPINKVKGGQAMYDQAKFFMTIVAANNGQ